MTVFLQTCLYVFAGCAVLGWLPPAVLAAKARKPELALLIVIATALVIFVLISAAGRLH